MTVDAPRLYVFHATPCTYSQTMEFTSFSVIPEQLRSREDKALVTLLELQVRKGFRARGRSAHSFDVSGPHINNVTCNDGRLFLQIRPALADPRERCVSLQRSNTTLIGNNFFSKDDEKEDVVNLQAVGEGKVQLLRTPQEKDRLPDRISLDRRGLSSIPNIVGEPCLRLLSLQHNLINSLLGLSSLDLGKLVFLDVYDNQIDKITSLDRLVSLRVLLMGKNRIKRIEGLANLIKLEVLDLHGNKIMKVGGLSNLNELKVLNLAGNQIKCIGQSDLEGLSSLRELNLKRNHLRKLLGFQNTAKLQKLYLGNNDLQSIEDVASVADAVSLTEVSLDGNPVALGGDCTPFLVSYLPNLITLTNMNITEQVRRAALAWRSNKEAAHAAYCALSGSAQQTARRDQIIHNARTNWELLRSENKSFANNTILTKQRDADKELSTECSNSTTHNGGTRTAETMDIPDLIASTRHVDAQDSDYKNNNDSSSKNITDKHNTKQTLLRKLQRSSTARKPSEKRVNFSERSASQETDASHSTSTSSDLRLPPILLPIMSSLENVKMPDGSEPLIKRWSSISSVEPIGDSSFSSFQSSSDSDEEANKKQLRRVPTVLRKRDFCSLRSKSVCDLESQRTKTISKNNDNVSNISCATNADSTVTSSTSSSDNNSKSLKRQGSLNSRLAKRNIRSATISRKNERASSANRASTAKTKTVKNLASLKSSEPVPKQMPVSKDREQGVDYLVEIGDGLVSAWGAGAIRRLAKDWEWDRARSVTRAAFHYIHFNAVAQCLPDLKEKFPNIIHISVRATGLQYLGQLHSLAELRGITGLTVMAEGNPISAKSWRTYAIYRLAHWGLKEIDEIQITEEETKMANATYNGLSDVVLRALPDAPLQPLLTRLGRSGSSTVSAKAWLRRADPALRDVIAKEALQYKKGHVSQEEMSWRIRGRGQLSHAIELACGAAQRLRTLDLLWPSIFVDMIEDVLKDFSDMESHVKEQMLMLIDSL